MNKRGNFAFILILLSTLFLVTAALFNFSTFKNAQEGYSKEVSKAIEERNFNYLFVLSVANSSFIQAQKYSSVEQARAEFKKFVSQHDFQTVSSGNFFGKVRNDEFTLEKNGDSWTLSIYGLFVQSKSGANVLKRDFNLIFKS